MPSGRGEEVNYTYDALNRLITASTTGPEWGLSFTYEGFGNKSAQTVTKGSGPSHSFAVDPATNRIIGATYGANGNQLPWSGSSYHENRLRNHNGESYEYDYANPRLYRWTSSSPNGHVTFFGIDGRPMGTYYLWPFIYHEKPAAASISPAS